MSNTFDSHCHPQFPHYDHDRNEVISRALERGVSMICVGTDIKTSKQALELAKNSGIWAAVGVHPNDLDDFVMDDFVHLINEEKVVAVGEVGLDYYRTKGDEKQKKQREVFKQFINLAYQYKKPLILHLRDSHKDAIEILKSAKDILYGGVAHSFTGTLEEAREYLNLGLHLGFNGIITFARQYNEVVIHTPLEKILLETDAPYLTPEPYRGQRNEPAYVLEVAKKVAEIKGISLEEVVETTTQNVLKLFINPHKG
jgi:TatD DNase family protein